MNPTNSEQSRTVGELLKSARTAQGFSIREVTARSQVARTTVLELEQDKIASPKPSVLTALASALNIELADLHAVAGFVPADGLPSFAPYLRSKYGDLPAKAQRELEQSFAAIADKYGYDANGPQPGQDEQ